MKEHLLIISSEYLSQYLKDMLRDYPDPIEYRVIEYHSFSELKGIYYANEKWADGILTTGTVVQTVIERSVSHISMPLLSLATDNESFYRIPLTLLIENRMLDPERIIFDVFVNSKPAASVRDLIEYKSINVMFPEFTKWLSSASLEELYHVEDQSLAEINKLWEKGKIDMVICRYGNLVPRLKELKIPCVFASFSDEYMYQIIQLLLTKIKIDKLTAHSPAAISIAPQNAVAEIWGVLEDDKLQKAFQDFTIRYDLDLSIHRKHNAYYIMTEKKILSYLTNDFQKSVLSDYLDKNTKLSLTVSYGIGNTMDEALDNTQLAFRAAGNTTDSYLVDAEHKLTGPLNTDHPVISSQILTPQIQEIADKSSLSTATVHRLNRLLILLERRELTSVDLAENFHITVRGANRILQKLESAGFVHSTLQKSNHMKGRPTKIYHIDWDI